MMSKAQIQSAIKRDLRRVQWQMQDGLSYLNKCDSVTVKNWNQILEHLRPVLAEKGYITAALRVTRYPDDDTLPATERVMLAWMESPEMQDSPGPFWHGSDHLKPPSKFLEDAIRNGSHM